MNKKYFLVCEALVLYEGVLDIAKRLAVKKELIPGTPQFLQYISKIIPKIEKSLRGGVYTI